MRSMIITTGLALVLTAGLAWSGENLAPEQTLPLADGRHAYQPGAAWGGDVFLVAWKSGHLGEGDLRQGIKYVGDLAACRVDKSGKVLDAKPIALSMAPDLQERPRVAFGNGSFLVVWQDYRSGKDWDVYAARVSPDGKVLDPDGVLVAGGDPSSPNGSAAASHNQALPEVAWNGKVFQVVWQDYRSGDHYDIYGARVGADGKVLDPGGKPLATAKAPVQRYGPVTAAAAADGKSLVFWRGTSNNQKQPIAGCLWTADGAPAGEAYVTADNRTAPGGGAQTNFPMCMAGGPEGFLGAWTTNVQAGRGWSANDAHAGVFGKDGKMKKTFLLFGEGGVGGGRIRNPAAAWAGSKYLVAWDQYPGGKRSMTEVVSAAEVSPDGGVSTPFAVSGSETEPAIKPCVASDGAGASLIAYEKHPGKADGHIQIGFRMMGK